MRIRNHKGFGHGLQPGRDSGLNCTSCAQETADGIPPDISGEDPTSAHQFCIYDIVQITTEYGGHFLGTIAEITDVDMLVQPNDSAVAAVYPQGYRLGRVHWPVHVQYLGHNYAIHVESVGDSCCDFAGTEDCCVNHGA